MAERLIHESRTLRLLIEDVTLPDGREVEFDVVRHPGAAAIVPFETDDEILLIRQFRHAAGGVIWEVPAGKLDGDAPEVCAAKELEEEVGRRPGRLVPLTSILTSPGFTDEVIHLFAAFELEKVPQRLEHDEFIEIVPMSLDRAVELAWSGEMSDAKSALAVLHAARHLGRGG